MARAEYVKIERDIADGEGRKGLPIAMLPIGQFKIELFDIG